MTSKSEALPLSEPPALILVALGGVVIYWCGFSLWATIVLCIIAGTFILFMAEMSPASSTRAHRPSHGTSSWEDEYEQELPYLSKKQWKREMEAQRRYENSREGRKRFEVTGYVIDNGHRGKVYCASTLDWMWTVDLPACFQIAEREWKALLAEADRNETWRRTRAPDAFKEALMGIINKKVLKRLKNQQRRNGNQQQQYSQQAQWDHHQQRDSRRQQTQPTAHVPLSGKYVGAAAEQPDLASMSVAQLRGFVQQTGSALADQASNCKDQPDLLSLAQRCMQLWECKRIISCSKLPHSNAEQELLAALCVLRVQTGQGPRQPVSAARSASAADLKRRYQRLALLVHPDKVVSEHQQQVGLFDEAFKVLGKAHDLASSYCAAS